MKIHKIVHDKGTKYKCIIIGHQVPNKNNLARHKKILYDRAKYLYRQCGHQAYSKGNLAQHKRSVHEGLNYPCRQCDIKHPQRGIYIIIKRQCMMESNTLAGISTIKQH